MQVTVSQESPTGPTRRLAGPDLARGLALLGMLLVNFDLVVSGRSDGPPALTLLVEGLYGKAAATFVVLAGLGASLGTRGRAGVSRARRRLRRRGAALLVGGTLLLTVWPADILHHYGLWLILGSFLLDARARVLGGVILGVTIASAVLVAQGDHFRHWNALTLEYRGVWTPAGYARHLVLDGFHPALPWFALYLVGILLGRLDLTAAVVRRRLLGAAATGVVLSSLAAWLAPSNATGALLRPTSLPPTPAFVLMGSSVAVLVILGSSYVAVRAPRAVAPVVAVGRLALTLYVAHVLVGFGVLEEAGRLGGESRVFAAVSAVAFYALCMVGSVAWLSRYERGPLESLLRVFDPRLAVSQAR